MKNWLCPTAIPWDRFLPEQMHQDSCRRQEDEEQQRAQIRPESQGHRERTEDDLDSSDRHQHLRGRHTPADRISGHHLPLSQMSVAGHKKLSRKKDPAGKDKNVQLDLPTPKCLRLLGINSKQKRFGASEKWARLSVERLPVIASGLRCPRSRAIVKAPVTNEARRWPGRRPCRCTGQ